MKRPHRYILFSILLVVVMAANAYAPPCVPTYDQREFFYSGCMGDRTLLKMERNLITFPDNIQEYIDTEGTAAATPYLTKSSASLSLIHLLPAGVAGSNS